MSITDPVPETLSFVCPRCAAPVTEPWYGPCSGCRTELRAQQRGEARDVEAATYEPKMNVTPNAVATKD
ncbi:MAG: hypothetical protein JWN46_3442 [Acidimicrobiales bacterium]|nr:hypothetical protein [Acidimicrobiales bacterium]